MPLPKIVFKYTELLPPLTKEQLDNLFKFMHYNGEKLLNMNEHESCCFADDYDILWRYAQHAANIGYGHEDLDAYIKDNYYGDDDEDEDDEDE